MSLLVIDVHALAVHILTVVVHVWKVAVRRRIVPQVDGSISADTGDDFLVRADSDLVDDVTVTSPDVCHRSLVILPQLEIQCSD